GDAAAHPQAGGDPGGQGGLAGAEGPVEDHHVAGPEQAGELDAQRSGVLHRRQVALPGDADRHEALSWSVDGGFSPPAPRSGGGAAARPTPSARRSRSRSRHSMTASATRSPSTSDTWAGS